MSYHVYIGDPADPDFKWQGGNWDGNVPRRIGPLFPPPEPFQLLLDRIETGRLSGAQVDWGGWVARADRAAVRAFIDDSYPGEWRARYRDREHMIGQLNELTGFAAGLDPHAEYLLVAIEQ